MSGPLLEPGSIGGLEIRNRLVRPATSETMATEDGTVTPQLIAFYEEMARNQVGLLITGHLYCHPRGQYAPLQMGVHDDSKVSGLSELAASCKRHGARIFGQVAHAGSQSRVPEVEPLAPSPVPNALTGRMVGEASEEEIAETIAAFAEGARRIAEAGFDGVHIHGANGYLISEFASPLANRRSDRWGGDAGARDEFPLAVARAVRAAVPADFPVTMKIGFADAPEGGLTVAESVSRAERVVAEGIDGIEVSIGVMQAPTDSANTYVAVDRKRAAQDLLVHRLFADPNPEAYFRPWAHELRKQVETKVILAGGMRTTETMSDVVASGDSDFVAMARPFIREPDIAAQIVAGRTGRVDCTSCNLCLRHEGHHSLRCWRTPRRRLLQHAIYRFSGGLRHGLMRTRH
ncbi:MAG: NADH:flavin oxidoreductase [Solirubrobacterales bacterium]|nr:NADH:flavin oxidoreductase [Solirubrobacterales bacterium]